MDNKFECRRIQNKYRVVILGSTFLGAGMAQAQDLDGIVLDSRPEVGYEFINAIKVIREELPSSVSSAEKETLYQKSQKIHGMMKDKNILLNCHVVEVKKTENKWNVLTHGICGYRQFISDFIADTRVQRSQVNAKSLNALIFLGKDGQLKPQENLQSNGECEILPYEDNIMALRYFLGLNDSYEEARNKLRDFICRQKGECKIIAIADYFDFRGSCNLIKTKDGYYSIPSCGFTTAWEAFSAGMKLAKEVTGK